MTICLCFLTYDKVLPIWDKFFENAPKNLYNVVSHIKSPSSETQPWLKKAKARTITTDWCGEGLVWAFINMLKKGLRNEDNKYFCLLSGSCIPLFNFQKTYKKIFSTKKARMSYERGYGNVFADRDDITNASQWCILNRKTATDLIRLRDKNDKKAKQFISYMRKQYRDNGVKVWLKRAIEKKDNTWVGNCPDETYPINWFIHLYGKNFRKYIKNQMTTYTYWNWAKSTSHPQTFDKETAKRYVSSICRKRDVIFARKFTDESDRFVGMRCKGLKT